MAEWLTRVLLCMEYLFVGLEAEYSPFDSGLGQCVFRVIFMPFVSIPTSLPRRSANAHF